MHEKNFRLKIKKKSTISAGLQRDVWQCAANNKNKWNHIVPANRVSGLIMSWSNDDNGVFFPPHDDIMRAMLFYYIFLNIKNKNQTCFQCVWCERVCARQTNTHKQTGQCSGCDDTVKCDNSTYFVANSMFFLWTCSFGSECWRFTYSATALAGNSVSHT